MAASPATAERIPRPVRILLGANFVSELGSGLTLPFLLIYLHDVRHLALSLTGLLIGGSAVIGIPVGPATGALVDKFGPRFICVGALLVNAAGALALIAVRSPLSALPALALYGIGNGSMWPAWTALFAVMVRDEGLRPRVFARNFQLLNLGLGVGSVVAGSVVRVSHPSSFELIYVIDAVTFGAVIAALALLPRRVFVRTADPADRADGAPAAGARGGYREVLADRRFRWYLLSTLLLVVAGYSAVNAGFVGYATTVVHVHPSVIAWAFGANTGLIVLLQPAALRVVDSIRRTTALMVAAGCFGSSWLVLGIAGLFPRELAGSVLVVAMFGVFALGEVMLAPVGATLVTGMARPSLVGRYNATASSVFSVAGVLGPAFAGAMLQARLGDAYLGLLMVAAAASALSLGHLRRFLSPALDNAADPRPVPEGATDPAARARDSSGRTSA